MTEDPQNGALEREEFVRVAAVGDIRHGRGRQVVVGDRRVALWRKGNRYYAFGDTCPHMGASLSDGFLQGEIIVCHWHGWRFDAGTGACLKQGKSWAEIPVYEVRIDGDDILLRRPSAGSVPAPEEDEPWMDWKPPEPPADPES